jgi:Cytochrome c
LILVKVVAGTFDYASRLGDAEDFPLPHEPGRPSMTSRGRYMVWPIAVAWLVGGGAANAQGDPEKGEKVFNKCKTCHMVEEATNKIGPHLVGIFGRQAGVVDGFKYSDAMKSSGVVWDDETIAGYLKDSQGLHSRQPDGVRWLEEGRGDRRSPGLPS